MNSRAAAKCAEFPLVSVNSVALIAGHPLKEEKNRGEMTFAGERKKKGDCEKRLV